MFTYQKQDKLKSRKQTQFLFSNGHSINAFPIKLIYTIETSPKLPEGLLQAGVGAPSRIFRKAVSRNRVKRLLRESYRLQKPSFLKQVQLAQKKVSLFFLYTDKVVLTQKEIEDKLKATLTQLAEKMNKI